MHEDRDLTPVGLVKWLLEPLSYVAVYVVLVQVIFNRGTEAYPLFVLCAVVPWQLFQGVVTTSMVVIEQFAPVIVNRDFALSVLPASLLLKEGASFLLGLVLLFPLMRIYDVPATPALLLLPAVVVALGLLTAGPAYLAATFGVYLPDFRNVANNLLRVAFLGSTALFRPEDIPGDVLPGLIELNPLSGIFNSLRAVVIDGQTPRAFDLLYPAAVGAFLLGLGVAVYRWRQHYFAKEL